MSSSSSSSSVGKKKRPASSSFSESDAKAAIPRATLTEEHLSQLRSQGYTVVHDVISKAYAAELFGMMQEAVQLLEPKVDMQNPATFGLLPYNVHALYQHYGAGQNRFAWECRAEMANVYAQLYNCHSYELLTSMDAFSFIPAGKKSVGGTWDGLLKKSSQSVWAHFDAGPARKGWFAGGSWTAQSQLVLVDSLTDDCAGFVVWPKSHLDHANFCAKEKGKLGMRADWIKLSAEQYEKALRGDYGHRWQPTRVHAPAGSMILWDSCTAHQNVRPAGVAAVPRGVVFACMQPREMSSPAQLLAKRKAFNDHKTTTHNPLETKCFDTMPSARWGAPSVPSGGYPLIKTAEELTPLQRRLAGFD